MSMAPREPVRVACALIERDGRLLLAQRPPGKSLALKWEFPGGKIEPGETAVTALQRELREELDIEVIIGREFAAVTHDYGGFVITLVPFACALLDGHEPRPHEHIAVRWCAPGEIEALDLAAADWPVWRNYRGA